MRGPIMKNHFITDRIDNLEQLIFVLHTHATIYVESWHKVHQTSFFHHRATYPIEKLIKMMNDGVFWCCITKESVKNNAINQQSLRWSESCRIINNGAPTVAEAAAAMAKFGSELCTIRDLVDAANEMRGK